MSIKINANFQTQMAKGYLDSKQQFATKLEMKDYNENLIPDGFITFCDEDLTNYQYLSQNEVDADTGRWRAINFGGADIIDDTLDTATAKTWSIDKIKEVISKMHEFVKVDALPDLTDSTVLDTIDLGKIYLVPIEDAEEGNAFDEYYIEYTLGTEAVMRTPLVADEVTFDGYIAEITDYVTNQGGTNTDDFATYSAVVTTTVMTEDVYNEMLESYVLTEDFATYTARVSAIEETPATQSSYKWEKLCSISGSVNLVYEEDVIVNNPIGKMLKTMNLKGMGVLEVVANMLQKDEAPTITITGNPSAETLYETGVASIADVALDIKINLGTGKIANGSVISIKKDDKEVATETYVDGTLTYTYTETGANLVADTEYTAEVAYEMNGTPASAPVKGKLLYDFALPLYYGVSATEDVADVTALTKKVSEDEKHTFTYTADNGYCILAIPDAYTITSIKDSNNFENVDSWTHVTQSVTIGTNAEVYKVYRTNTKVTCVDFKYMFTLA